MREEQFNHLPSQGTIYSTSRLGDHLIIGTGDGGKVFAVMDSHTLLQQIPLQNLPHECDIISVDAYIDAFPVLAVAFVQKSSSSVLGCMHDGRGKSFITSHLNIYSTWISADQQDSPTSSASSEGSKFKISFHPKEEFHSSQFELLAQNCTSFLLDYIPYHLYHVPVLKQNGNYGNILLLSGSNRKINSFESDDDNLTFVEVPVKGYFPELAQTFSDIVTRILIQPVNEITRRITLCGLETGNLLIWVVTSKFNNRKRTDSESTSGSLKSQHGAPELSTSQTEKLISITDLSLEQSLEIKNSSEGKGADDSTSEGASGDSECMSESILDSSDESFERIEHNYDGLITSIRSFTDGFNLNIIVASALSPTYVYKNVIEEHFNLGTPLKFSSRFDAVECCCVEDVDRDGENEIVLGTFGCTLLVYKYMDEILPEWVIVSKKKFPSSVLAVEWVNGFLHVVTGLGLHIVEYDTSAYFTNKPEAISPESVEEIKYLP